MTTGRCCVDAKRQLSEYFAGERRAFDLPLDFGGTEFQRSVWETLLTIPYGETWSYADVAEPAGQADARPARWAPRTGRTRSRSSARATA